MYYLECHNGVVDSVGACICNVAWLGDVCDISLGGESLTFDGNDYFEVPNVPYLIRQAQAFTLESYIYLTSNSTDMTLFSVYEAVKLSPSISVPFNVSSTEDCGIRYIFT